MPRKNRKGWPNEPQRHACSSYGIETAHARQDTMFGPPTHDELAEVITIKNPELAEKSLDTLSDMFEEAPRTAEDEDTITKSDIIHAVQLASNRAEAFLDRENLSEKEEKEMKEVSEIYDEWVDDHKMTAEGRNPPKYRRYQGKNQVRIDNWENFPKEGVSNLKYYHNKLQEQGYVYINKGAIYRDELQKED